MRKLLFVFATIVFILGSCKKSSDTTATVDFLPLTVGSNWTYLMTPGGTSKLTVTNRDSIALGRTYKVLSNSNGPNNYWAKSGANYYRFGNLQGIIPGGFEELYLKDDQAVNATWSLPPLTITFSGTNYTVNSLYKVLEKGISKTVQAKNYTNVTHVRLDLTTTFFGIPVPLGGGDFYYASGIGLISGALTITIPGQPAVTNTTELTAHEIK